MDSRMELKASNRQRQPTPGDRLALLAGDRESERAVEMLRTESLGQSGRRRDRSPGSHATRRAGPRPAVPDRPEGHRSTLSLPRWL